ncbi:hypothetical protein KR018_002177, partial [Drosophila ironensis]
DVWTDHNNQKLLPGDRTSAHLGSLKPAQAYHVRIYAENTLGISAPSDTLSVVTDSEVPSGSPRDVTTDALGPQQLLITWRAPPRDTWNGDILGYTIAYGKRSSLNDLKNHTKVNNLRIDGFNDFRLVGLEKYTQYAISISAYNSKGEGPDSDVVLGHTLEDTPSASPQSVSCLALTAQNIQVLWQSPPKDQCHGVIQGYKIFYESINVHNEYTNRETKITSALNTVLHGLLPFTNYSVEVLAFTRAGEGTLSTPISCITEEAVPDAPERVKSIVSSESSVIISWLPPRRPNGLIINYNVYIRILEKNIEQKILKEMLPAQNRYFEARDLDLKESYEAWVTASTRVGQGPSTPVLQLIPNSLVPATIVSFSQIFRVSWGVDVKLPCFFVGKPKATAEWTFFGNQWKNTFKMETNIDNTLSVHNVQRVNEGNYSCKVKNTVGSDQIIYKLFVKVPPSTPILSVTSIQQTSISLQWRVDDTGGTKLKGFVLKFRQEKALWEEIVLDGRLNSYVIENLDCGSRYQFSMISFNAIGRSPSSKTEKVKTRGDTPIPPPVDRLIRLNITSISLDLSSWNDGGCPISHFGIEFKLHESSSKWIIVSNKIESHARYVIGDLEPGTSYNLRVTAHNNAGSTNKELYFTTLNINEFKNKIASDERQIDKSIFTDSQLIAVIVTSIFGTILALAGAFLCFKNFPVANADTLRTRNLTGEKEIQNGDFYGTVRKSCHLSPPESEIAHGIEASNREDIYPYATFHLPEHENQSENISLGHTGKSLNLYDSQYIDKNTLYNGKIEVQHSSTFNISEMHPNSGGIKLNTSQIKMNHNFKILKSESEEYDSLNSDSDRSNERIR